MSFFTLISEGHFFTEYKILGRYYVPPPSTLKMLSCVSLPPMRIGQSRLSLFLCTWCVSLSPLFSSVLWLHWRFFSLCLVFISLTMICLDVILFMFILVAIGCEKGESVRCSVLSDYLQSWGPGSSVHGILKARILEWVSHSFLQGVFLTQRSNLNFLHCRQILYGLSHQGSAILVKIGVFHHIWEVFSHLFFKYFFSPSLIVFPSETTIINILDHLIMFTVPEA